MSQRAGATAPAPAWKTEGIAPMERPGVVVRVFMAIVAFAERLNRACARLGSPCVYDTAAFPWAADIEREWRAVREELDRVMVRKAELPNVQDITADAASLSQDADWKIFPLIAYGIRSQPNIELCPETWRIVRSIPGLTTAMFSILEPGKRLPPHRGPYNGVLRLHLGLLIPEPRERLAIRVGPDQCHWQEGRVLIFDDAYEHEAWNESSQVRVVLFVDFAKPLGFPANLLNRLLLGLAVFTPFVREGGANLREWERRFHGEPSRRIRG
jgi:ornithine lipid ester-linked acyl 2-hydroxylase